MKKLLLLIVASIGVCSTAIGQPRPAERAQLPARPAAVAPAVFNAKYQGGVFGFSEKETGTLKVDELNQRIVFLGKDKKEMFGIPFKSVLMVSPQKTVGTATTGKVVSMIPLPGAGLASLMREKKRYLVVHFDDPDVDAKGVVSFKIDDKAVLTTAIQAVGESAKLTRRGDTYYRPREPKSDI